MRKGFFAWLRDRYPGSKSGIMLAPDRLKLPSELLGDCIEAGDLVRVLRTWAKEKPRRVPLDLLARTAGIDPSTLRKIIKTGFVRSDTARRLTPTVQGIASGQLYFRRYGWQIMRKSGDPQLVRTPARRRAPTEGEFNAATQQNAAPGRAKNTT